MLAEGDTSVLTIGIPAFVGLVSGLAATLLLRRTNRESNETNFLAQAVEAWKVIAEAAKQDYEDLRVEAEQERAASELHIAENRERIMELERQLSSVMFGQRHNNRKSEQEST